MEPSIGLKAKTEGRSLWPEHSAGPRGRISQVQAREDSWGFLCQCKKFGFHAECWGRQSHAYACCLQPPLSHIRMGHELAALPYQEQKSPHNLTALDGFMTLHENIFPCFRLNHVLLCSAWVSYDIQSAPLLYLLPAGGGQGPSAAAQEGCMQANCPAWAARSNLLAMGL